MRAAGVVAKLGPAACGLCPWLTQLPHRQLLHFLLPDRLRDRSGPRASRRSRPAEAVLAVAGSPALHPPSAQIEALPPTSRVVSALWRSFGFFVRNGLALSCIAYGDVIRTAAAYA